MDSISKMVFIICFVIAVSIFICQPTAGMMFGAKFVSLSKGNMRKSRQSYRLSTELHFKTQSEDEKESSSPLYYRYTNQEPRREVPFKHSKFSDKAVHTPKPEYGHRYHLRLLKPDIIEIVSKKHEVDSLMRVLPDLSRSLAQDIVDEAHDKSRALIRVYNTKDDPKQIVEQLRHFHPPIKAEVYDTKTLSTLLL